jgi:hypothetical protein
MSTGSPLLDVRLQDLARRALPRQCLSDLNDLRNSSGAVDDTKDDTGCQSCLDLPALPALYLVNVSKRCWPHVGGSRIWNPQFPRFGMA